MLGADGYLRGRLSSLITPLELEFVEHLRNELNVNEGFDERESYVQVKCWFPPDLGYVKLNVDAACFEDWVRDWGAVIRRDDGSAAMCASCLLNEKWELQIAEAKAILFGLSMVAVHGHRLVVLVSDCQSLVKAIHAGECS